MPTPQVHKLHTLYGHRDCVYTLQGGNEPSCFFSGAGDGMVVAWDLNKPEEGERIAQLPNSVYALHHLKKSDYLVAGHNYEGIHLLDWKNKKEMASLQLTIAAIFDINSFQNDLLVATGEGMIVVVDIEKWVIKKMILASEKSVRTIAINEARGEMAVGYSDHFIRVFALDDFKLISEFKAHENSVFALSYMPDTNFLISGSRDARLKVWDASNHYQQVEEVAAHLYAINHISFSPDGQYFATASMDKSIKVWRTNEIKLLKVIDKARHTGHGTSVNKLLWTSFNDQLVSASDDKSISVWGIEF
ncbi:MAG: WD40 repeat domain-containing protein [Cyclobacteriaceae bacterium]|jgi:WD40 repeat protein